MEPTSIIRTTVYRTPAGDLLLGSTGDRLSLCNWLSAPDSRLAVSRLASRLKARIVETPSPVTAAAAAQLVEYFAGRRRDFDIPMHFAGTDFSKAVWRALSCIPYGRTTTYKALAATIGRPTAVRAVAAALHANPIAIFAPCHRVIGMGGALTGYAGGLHVKQCLLTLEATHSNIFKPLI